ncbi:hypothetical protein BV22DRAFT_106015 [Leucogyrophana mollusca]|uniref:Uncharacterized protein n=1 Tax=Leucogyrophana mollusca TaxID=85980 RepID=A0ACB8BVJ2_9AGAM|nr:hypothetical protein BV22DRAFT_106015 [Leucogyrophana mollusca]
MMLHANNACSWTVKRVRSSRLVVGSYLFRRCDIPFLPLVLVFLNFLALSSCISLTICLSYVATAIGRYFVDQIHIAQSVLFKMNIINFVILSMGSRTSVG